MLSNFIQISFLILIIYISYKSESFLLSNYLIGFVLLLFFTDLNFQGESRALMFEIIMFLYNIPLYTILFASSLFIYFDQENDKSHYFLIPFLLYLFIIILELFFLRMSNAFMLMFLPILVAFFPLYILKYYRKY